MADTTSGIELGFIGFGNMAQAMAQGLVDSGRAFRGEHIHACAGHFDKLQASAEKLGVNAYREAAEVVRASDFVVLAVKPLPHRTGGGAGARPACRQGRDLGGRRVNVGYSHVVVSGEGIGGGIVPGGHAIYTRNAPWSLKACCSSME